MKASRLTSYFIIATGVVFCVLVELDAHGQQQEMIKTVSFLHAVNVATWRRVCLGVPPIRVRRNLCYRTMDKAESEALNVNTNSYHKVEEKKNKLKSYFEKWFCPHMTYK